MGQEALPMLAGVEAGSQGSRPTGFAGVHYCFSLRHAFEKKCWLYPRTDNCLLPHSISPQLSQHPLSFITNCSHLVRFSVEEAADHLSSWTPPTSTHFKMTDPNDTNSSEVAVGDPMVHRHLASYIETRTPGSYLPNPYPTSPSRFMSWQYIIDVLSHGDLDQLCRDPVCDTAYRSFAPGVRAQYDGIENYIRQVRLGWPAEKTVNTGPNMLDRPQKDPLLILSQLSSSGSPSGSGVSTPNGTKLPLEAVKETWPEKILPHPTQPGIVLRHFVADADADAEGGQSLVKTIPNDWPYGIPAGCTHWCVWSKLPILHPSLFSTPDTPFPESLREELYNCVTGDGIRGFAGFTPSSPTNPIYQWNAATIPEILGSYSQAKLAQLNQTGKEPEEVQLTKELVSQAHSWASRHVTRYIIKTWPEEKFETAWFCNPPELRTVPGLSHFQ